MLLAACSPPPESPPASPGASPAASPRPPLTARQTVYVGNTDRYGADFRRTPGAGGELIRVVPDGAVLEATGRAQQVDEQTWNELRDSTGAVGWVIADYLSAAPPPLATSTPMSVAPAPTPLRIATPIPETPPPTAGPRPTDTLVPIPPPARDPALAPLPPAPTDRPAPPTLPPLAPVRPTSDASGADTEPTRTRGATLVPTRGPTGR